MHTPVESVTLTREELYELVWSTPMRKLAPRFGLSDSGLATTCREMRIPLPWRGYWAQLSAGKKVRRPVLGVLPVGSPARLQSVTLGTSNGRSRAEPEIVVGARVAETKPENLIKVGDRLHRPHPLVQRTREVLQRASHDERGILFAWRESYLDIRVSKASLDRALRIMDAAVKAIEMRGFSVYVTSGDNRETRVRAFDEEVALRLEERTSRSERELEPGKSYVYPRYAFKPTGALVLEIESYLGGDLQKSWSDGKRKRLEERLNEFVVGVIAAANRKREWRIERERREQEWKAAEQRRAESKRQQERERVRIEVLEKQASAWDRSRQIRGFVEVVRAQLERGAAGDNRENMERWIEWALRHADSIDPLVANGWIHEVGREDVRS